MKRIFIALFLVLTFAMPIWAGSLVGEAYEDGTVIVHSPDGRVRVGEAYEDGTIVIFNSGDDDY